MTAYGASLSLQNTIDYILHSSHFTIVGRSRDIIQVAYEELQPLRDILKRLDLTRTSRSRKKVNALDGRIKDLIWEFENSLESLVSQQILSQIPNQIEEDEEMKERIWDFQGLFESLPSQKILFQSSPPHHTRRRRSLVHKSKREARRKINTPRLINIETQVSQSRSLEDDVGGQRLRFSIDLHCLQDHVRSFIRALKYTKREYIFELLNMAEDDEDESVSSIIRTKSKMVGLSDQFQQLKIDLIDWRMHFFALVGTGGIGKTAISEAIFEDSEILSHFQYRAWVTVGIKSQFNQVSQDILAQTCGITQGEISIRDYLELLE